MVRRFKRGYIEKGWWNSLLNKWIANEYAITITKVKQNNFYGKWDDEDEDELIGFGGYKTKEEALADLKKEKVKEIIDECK